MSKLKLVRKETPKRGNVKPIAVAKFKTRIIPHYVKVELWADYPQFREGTGTTDENVLASFMPIYWTDPAANTDHVKAHLGTLSFVSGNWTLDTLCHEIQHALIHRMRFLAPDVHVMMNIRHEHYNENAEEAICYQAGEWMQAMFDWLVTVDPKSPYQKSTAA
jgi:hypothetical protein